MQQTDLIAAKLRTRKHLKIEFDTKMETVEKVNAWKEMHRNRPARKETSIQNSPWVPKRLQTAMPTIPENEKDARIRQRADRMRANKFGQAAHRPVQVLEGKATSFEFSCAPNDTRQTPKPEQSPKDTVFCLQLLVPQTAMGLLNANVREVVKRNTGCTGMKFLVRGALGAGEGKRILQFKGSRKSVREGEEFVQNRVEDCIFKKLEAVKESRPARAIPKTQEPRFRTSGCILSTPERRRNGLVQAHQMQSSHHQIPRPPRRNNTRFQRPNHVVKHVQHRAKYHIQQPRGSPRSCAGVYRT